MLWFESKEDKDARIKAEEKMKIYLKRPSAHKSVQSDKYDAALKDMISMVNKSNQKVIETIVDHIKETIKDDDVEPMVKLRCIELLRDLMETHNKALGKYVVKKILKRLTILAEHRKNEKDENRGTNIFKCKKHEEQFGVEFLKTLLLALEDWGKNWPKNVDGPFQNFSSAYNELLMEKQVSFPIEEKKIGISRPLGGSLPRNSIEEINSPPKAFLDSRKVENFPSRPVIKERASLNGESLEYITAMKETLEIFSVILKENQEYNEIWPTIKDYIEQFKQINKQADFLFAQMIQNKQENTDLYEAVKANIEFLADLTKDTAIVDKKSTSYALYNTKYQRKCKKIALSLSVFLDKPGSSQANNSGSLTGNRPGIDISINDRLEKVEEVRPKIQEERNRYGSGNELRNQLQINQQQIKKEDFSSGTHKFHENSEGGAGSSRYNSIHEPERNKNVVNNNNKMDEEENEEEDESNEQRRESSHQKVDLFNEDKFKKQSESIINPFKNKEMSKISEKTEKNANNNFNDFDFEKDDSSKGKNNVDGSFGDFEMNKSKEEKEDSNSMFFREKEEKDQGFNQPTNMRSRKHHNINKNENFFENSIKSKNDSENLSGFNKSKSKEQEEESKRDSKNENPKGFDTFKNPQEVANFTDELRKSVKSRTSEVSNPFAPNDYENNNQNNSMNRSQLSNPFQTSVPDVSKNENPFETSQNNAFGRENENPFASKINGVGVFEKDNENEDNKSKSSNPFSSKDPESKIYGKSSIKSKPPIPSRKSETDNPFDEDDPFAVKNQLSNISNPFRSNEEKGSGSEKSLSKRGSFVNARNTERISANNMELDDPFENNGQKNQKESLNSAKEIQKDQNSFDMSQNRQSMESKEKSFQGFNFSDFMNASGQKSEASKKDENKINQSGFNFSDFGNANENRGSFPGFDQKQNLSMASKNNESFDFFNQRESITEKQNQQVKESFFNSKSFVKDEEPKQEEKSIHKNSFDNLAFGFDDFGNGSKSSHSKSPDTSKNPFSDFEVSKGTIEVSKKEREVPKLNLGDKTSQISDDEWNKFGDLGEKIAEKHFQRVEESRYSDSEKNIESPRNQKDDYYWFNNQLNNKHKPEKDYSPERNIKEPHFGQEEKSISIQFDSPSPFQKKEVSWNSNLVALPSSARYNVTQEDVQFKKQLLSELEHQNEKKIAEFKELSEKLASLKKVFSSNIEKVSEAREQKKEFTQILQRLTESNEIKEREIEELIKKTKKAEEIKNKILENERILYERMKEEKRNKQEDVAYRERVGNKWERFNSNLKKQREGFQMEKSISNFSYYA